LRAAAKAALEQKTSSYELSRLVAIAIYRFDQIYEAFVNADAVRGPFDRIAPALQAWLEVSIIKGKNVQLDQATIDACIGAFLARNSGTKALQDLAGSILTLLQRVSPTQSPSIISQLQEKLPTVALASPAIFDKLSLDTLVAISKQSGSIEAFAVLETLVNESMKWLVRRFAEDAANSSQVSEFIQALGDF
jgi:hypothetical protein